MAAQPGYVATLLAGTAPNPTHQPVGINDVQAPYTAAQYDITSLGAAGWSSFLAGLKSGKPVVKGSWDKSDTNGQAVIEAAFFANTLLYFIASPNGGTNTYAFTAYVSDLQIHTPVNNVSDVQYTLQITGAVTVV